MSDINDIRRKTDNQVSFKKVAFGGVNAADAKNKIDSLYTQLEKAQKSFEDETKELRETCSLAITQRDESEQKLKVLQDELYNIQQVNTNYEKAIKELEDKNKFLNESVEQLKINNEQLEIALSDSKYITETNKNELLEKTINELTSKLKIEKEQGDECKKQLDATILLSDRLRTQLAEEKMEYSKQISQLNLRIYESSLVSEHEIRKAKEGLQNLMTCVNNLEIAVKEIKD